MESIKQVRRIWWLAVFLLFLGCSPPAPQIIYETVSVRVTATPGATIAPTASPTVTPTEIPTPTPTPTAPAISVVGDPRGAALQDPVPQSGAACGLVDILDFPLDPPDGLQARGGGDFGRYRGRYDKYHAGEDWGLQSRSNFGAPVYSIGHGQVTYAAPNGWGADQGVVIIRHVFRGGRTVLSFYGHLDPPSITLRPGQCVARGAQIGEIGRPRTPPHLHFEIRTHLPDTPGPGYWEVDPVRAGWLPPSSFVWEQRLNTAPGVAWVLPWEARDVQRVGLLFDGTYAVIHDATLSTIEPSDGSIRWTVPISSTITAGARDLSRDQIYLADRMGELQALRPNGEREAVWPQEWVIELEQTGTAQLLPLPAGGVAVAAGGELSAFSPSGARLWNRTDIPLPQHWIIDKNRLVFTTGGSSPAVWEADASGVRALTRGLGGRPLAHNGGLFVLDVDGFYRLSPAPSAPDLLLALPESYQGLGDLMGLPDGGILIAHIDRADRRLIALNADGSLRWERSFAALGLWQPELVKLQDQYLLILQGSSLSQGGTMIFSIDLEPPGLTLLFSGGTRTPRPQGTWGAAVDNELLLLNIGGGALTGFTIPDEATILGGQSAP